MSYGQNGWDWSASARYTHQGNLDLSRPARERVEESLDVEPEPINPNLLACANCSPPEGTPDYPSPWEEVIGNPQLEREFNEGAEAAVETGRISAEAAMALIPIPIPILRLAKVLLAGSRLVRLINVIPKGKLANHLFKGIDKLADTPKNRRLIFRISNRKPFIVDKWEKVGTEELTLLVEEYTHTLERESLRVLVTLT